MVAQDGTRKYDEEEETAKALKERWCRRRSNCYKELESEETMFKFQLKANMLCRSDTLDYLN